MPASGHGRALLCAGRLRPRRLLFDGACRRTSGLARLHLARCRIAEWSSPFVALVDLKGLAAIIDGLTIAIRGRPVATASGAPMERLQAWRYGAVRRPSIAMPWGRPG